MQETWVQSLGWEEPLEEEMAIHSSILAWETYGHRSLEGCRLWSRRRLGHDRVTTQQRQPRILFIHALVGGHLGCFFHFLAI